MAPAAKASDMISGKAIADSILQTTNAISDSVVSQDAALYTKLNIAGRFGVTFKPHIAVCAGTPEGEAHCNARVVINAQGVPAVTPDTLSTQVTTKALPAGYGPAQLLGGYNLTGQASGHPVIAIVDAYDDPNITNDLNTYSTTFGIPALPTCSGAIANSPVACFEKINQKGQMRAYPQSNSGWALEIALDVEAAHATCQNCSIVLVEASSATYSNLMAAIDQAVAQGAKVVSNSWGSSEFLGEASYDSHFNRPGVAFTVSAGDGGYGTEYPAASPYVTAVGGTSLFLTKNSNGTYSYNNEMVWGGTGSGCSSYELQPSWQTALGLSGCSKRIVADVSADADPNTGASVYDSVRYAGMSGWFQVGGTSLASPLIAAVYALSGNIPANTSENSIPYKNTGNLHDVMLGSNGSCGGSYLCTAMSGFDGPTGLGTPNGTTAF